jgi:hypothetical protein
VSIVLKTGSLNLLETSGPLQAGKGIALPLLIEEQVNTTGFDGPHTVQAGKCPEKNPQKETLTTRKFGIQN